CHDHGERGAWMAQDLNRKERAANGANHSVNGVPDRIDPWDFIGEKFQEIENASDGDDPRVTKDPERLVLRRQRDPMKMNCQTSDENCQIKIDAGERGKPESHGNKVESLHEGIIQRS